MFLVPGFELRTSWFPCKHADYNTIQNKHETQAISSFYSWFSMYVRFNNFCHLHSSTLFKDNFCTFNRFLDKIDNSLRFYSSSSHLLSIILSILVDLLLFFKYLHLEYRSLMLGRCLNRSESESTINGTTVYDVH